MLKDRENILNALREKPQKAYQLMRRANLPNEEACQSPVSYTHLTLPTNREV